MSLKSENGSEYSHLQALLQTGAWQEADQETYRVMIHAVGKQECDGFTRDELLNFPYADLLTIDRLWVSCSDGQFGFSVQKEIYLACGGVLDGNYHNTKAWEKFGDRVGWRSENEWLRYSTIVSSSSQRGKFPAFLGSGGGLGWFVGWLSALLSNPDL